MSIVSNYCIQAQLKRTKKKKKEGGLLLPVCAFLLQNDNQKSSQKEQLPETIGRESRKGCPTGFTSKYVWPIGYRAFENKIDDKFGKTWITL